MADVAAKREARRRRILENSENRLRRITGHIDRDETSDEKCKKTIETQPTTSSSNPNGISASEALEENSSVDSLIDEFDADIEVENSTKNSPYTAEHVNYSTTFSTNLSHRRNEKQADCPNENGSVGSMKLNSSSSDGFSGGNHFFSESTLDNSGSDIPRTKSDRKDTTIVTIFSSRLIYVILAIVVNFMVIAKSEHLFGESIVIPFIVVMIGRFCVCRNDDTANGNNILMTALILCNVRPDVVKVIHRLRGSFTLFNRIFRDFSVYIFTFVLLYAVMSRYRNELDDIPTSRVNIDNSFDDEITI